MHIRVIYDMLLTDGLLRCRHRPPGRHHHIQWSSHVANLVEHPDALHLAHHEYIRSFPIILSLIRG